MMMIYSGWNLTTILNKRINFWEQIFFPEYILLFIFLLDIQKKKMMYKCNDMQFPRNDNLIWRRRAYSNTTFLGNSLNKRISKIPHFIVPVGTTARNYLPLCQSCGKCEIDAWKSENSCTFISISTIFSLSRKPRAITQIK